MVLVNPCGDVAADHRAHQVTGGQLADRLRQHPPPIAQHGHALADRKDLLQAVGDEDDRDAVLAQALDDAEQPRDLSGGERRGRLVHHDDAGVERQRLADLDDLLLGNRQAAGYAVGVDRHAQPLEQRSRLALHRAVVDPPATAQGLAGNEDVLGNRDVREEGGLLEDDRDPGVARGRRPGQDERVAVGVDERATVGRVDAAEDLDERGFAGAVLADDGVDLAAVEVDRDTLQSLYGAERLAGVVHPEDRPPSGARDE